MDVIANADDLSSKNRTENGNLNFDAQNADMTMESNSQTSNDPAVESDSSTDYQIDQITGKKVRRVYETAEQRKSLKQRKIMNKLKTHVGQFFKQNTIGDMVADNQKIIVLNHECSISQSIEAMIRQQNVRTAIVWNNEKREFQQIFTLRDLLECTLYVAEHVQDIISKFENQIQNHGNISEINFSNSGSVDQKGQIDQQKLSDLIRANSLQLIDQFLQKYILDDIEHAIYPQRQEENNIDEGNTPNQLTNNIANFMGGSQSQRLQMRGFELIFKIFEQITIQEWLRVQRSLSELGSNYGFQKSELIDMSVNAKIIEAVHTINGNGLREIALSANEKSELQGLINTQDIFKFLLDNYKGEVDFFSREFSQFEFAGSNISTCSRNQNLVKAAHTDTLYEVLRKIRENRVNVVLIERNFVTLCPGQPPQHQEHTETVGVIFISDIVYLLKQANFHEILTQPVIKFVMKLNGTEEDRQAYKLRNMNYQLDSSLFGNNNPNQPDGVSEHSHSVSQRKQSVNIGADGNQEMTGADGVYPDVDNDADDFFNFGGSKTSKSRTQTSNKNQQSPVRKGDNAVSGNQKNRQGDFDIDDIFGHIFGIERVHLLKKTDKLIDVIEKIAVVPENKLLWVERKQIVALRTNQNNGMGAGEEVISSYQVHNILTLSDLLSYLTPQQQDSN